MAEGARLAAMPRAERSGEGAPATFAQAPAPARRRSGRALAPARPTMRVPELMLGVLLVAGCALGAVLWQQSSSTTRQALVLAHDVRRGDLLGPTDFTAADVRATGARFLPFEDAERLAGRVAAADLSALTPLTDDLAVETIPLGADESLVGRRLELGQFPSGLKAGDHVVVVLVDSSAVLGPTQGVAVASPLDVGSVPAPSEEPRPALTAVIESMAPVETGSGDVVATLRVSSAYAERIAASSEVRLAQVAVAG